MDATKSALRLLVAGLHLTIPFISLIAVCNGEMQHVLSQGQNAADFCLDLPTEYFDIVHFPDSTEYQQQQAKYWSGQQAQDLRPGCRITPATTEFLGTVIALLVEHKVHFAVESGGHSSVVGASNIASGVVVDLHRLNSIRLSDELQTVEVGVGSTWLNLYLALESYNLTVAGARAGSVGVGGFALGGGLSWFANTHGWACDTVEQMEVVLADGRIVKANRTSHSELFKALKGTGGLLGIVSSVTLRVIPTSAVYGGAIAYPLSELDNLLSALATLNDETTEDSQSSAYLSFGVLPLAKEMLVTAYLVDRDSRPTNPLTKSFTTLPQTWNDLRMMNFSDAAAEIGPLRDRGRRGGKFTLTIRSSTSLMKLLVEVFQGYAMHVSLGPSDLLGMTLQSLSLAHLQDRDNILGLSSESVPLILVSVELLWEDKSRDLEFSALENELCREMSRVIQASDKGHRFIYLNYASASQKPLGTYGIENLEMLRRVQEMYDPRQAMTIIRQGCFQIPS